VGDEGESENQTNQGYFGSGLTLETQRTALRKGISIEAGGQESFSNEKILLTSRKQGATRWRDEVGPGDGGFSGRF